MAAEFNVLGPLEIRRDGTALGLGGTRRRELIAALLLRANEVVTAEALLDALCGDPNATNALQANVSRLRRDLGPVAERLQTLPGGYRLEVRDGELDAQRFERALGAARGAEPALARQTLEAALGLWRGPVLGELGLEAFAQSEVRRLEELRLSALEERIEAELALGVPAIGELEALVAEHPLRERLRGQLMLALSLAGRHADALAAYRAGRAALDELGMEPAPELRQLEQAILTHARPRGTVPVLPTPTIGREEDLERADVTVLATSRQPLDVLAEQCFPVAPLGEQAAVRLFETRAQARAASVGDHDAIAAICRRLGGLPLAIELAAGRLGLLDAHGLAARLDDALAPLGSGALRPSRPAANPARDARLELRAPHADRAGGVRRISTRPNARRKPPASATSPLPRARREHPARAVGAGRGLARVHPDPPRARQLPRRAEVVDRPRPRGRGARAGGRARRLLERHPRHRRGDGLVPGGDRDRRRSSTAAPGPGAAVPRQPQTHGAAEPRARRRPRRSRARARSLSRRWMLVLRTSAWAA